MDPSASVTPRSLADIARQNPRALKWPIVVDWMGGRAAIGDLDGVKKILDAFQRERDGVKEDGNT